MGALPKPIDAERKETGHTNTVLPSAFPQDGLEVDTKTQIPTDFASHRDQIP